MAFTIALGLRHPARKGRCWWPVRFFVSRQGPQSLGDDGAIFDEAVALQTFQDLFSRYQKPIADFLYRMTRDRELAADLTQDTFLKAYIHRAELGNIANVRAWLYRIAANTARNALRRQHHFGWVSLADLQPGEAGEPSGGVVLAANGDLATSVVERDTLETALQTLSPTARAVILLRATGGFETGEIANMMHISEANARKILYRAKEKLRAALEAASGDRP